LGPRRAVFLGKTALAKPVRHSYGSLTRGVEKFSYSNTRFTVWARCPTSLNVALSLQRPRRAGAGFREPAPAPSSDLYLSSRFVPRIYSAWNHELQRERDLPARAWPL